MLVPETAVFAIIVTPVISYGIENVQYLFYPKFTTSLDFRELLGFRLFPSLTTLSFLCLLPSV
jgi:hypothetical protein